MKNLAFPLVLIATLEEKIGAIQFEWANSGAVAVGDAGTARTQRMGSFKSVNLASISATLPASRPYCPTNAQRSWRPRLATTRHSLVYSLIH